MNILHTESGLNWGGQEYRAIVEIMWLNSHGHKAWLACDPASQAAQRAHDSKVPVLPLRMGRWSCWLGLFKLWRFCRRNEIDVIQTHSPMDSWLCVPLHLLGYKVVRSRNVTQPVAKTSRTLVYRYGCSHLIATANCIRDNFVKLTRVPPERIDVVGEGVDLAVFNTEVDGKAVRDELGVPLDAPLVGMVAMLRCDKGATVFVDAAIKILRQMPEARFVLVGEGRQRAAIERKIQEYLAGAVSTPESSNHNEYLRSPIILTGYRNDTNRMLAAFDIVVIPSLSEARCRVVSEAFATGKPVVASRVGGIPEIVQDGFNGLLVPARDPHALAAAVQRLIAEPKFRAQLASNAARTAQESMSLDAVMGQILDIYRKVCRQPKPVSRFFAWLIYGESETLLPEESSS